MSIKEEDDGWLNDEFDGDVKLTKRDLKRVGFYFNSSNWSKACDFKHTNSILGYNVSG